jgi:hypothetical protein
VSQWVQNGEKVYVRGKDGELKARVCVASSMDHAAEIVKLRQACSGSTCQRARTEFVRGVLAGMTALGTSGPNAAEACSSLGITGEEVLEVAQSAAPSI